MPRSGLGREDLPGALAAVVLVNLVGGAPAVLGGPDTAWFAALAKPDIYPPPWAFGVVWPILFALLGVALYLVWRTDADGRPLALGLFVTQMTFNVAWTPAFFLAQNLVVALGIIVVLFALAAATAVAFRRVSRLAGALLVPYLLWVAFAAALNYQFVALN